MCFLTLVSNSKVIRIYKYLLAVSIVTLLLGCSSPEAHKKKQRRFPCDPKFGLLGNYFEMTVSAVTGDDNDVQVCFESKENQEKEKNCLALNSLPGRYRAIAGNGWSDWQVGVPFDHRQTRYQFGLCGDKQDDSVWQNFHKGRNVDAWDHMRLRNAATGSLLVERVRLVQNRVRILDDENVEEGRLHVLLGKDGQVEVDLSERIRRSKINRVSCLNLRPGRPYCEGRISGLEPTTLPPVIKQALLELGHSGSKKFGRENVTWCSEFAFFIIKDSTQLSEECSHNVPNPGRHDLNANSLFRWFSSCGRVIPRSRLQFDLQPGDYLSVHGRTHSTLFLGWADSQKNFFWEISGNNQCRPELETLIAPTYMGNAVCIAKREFLEEIEEKDFGGRTRR